MGTAAHFITKLAAAGSRNKRVTFTAEKCVACKLCSKACPVEIDVFSYKEHGKVMHADCLKCNMCVNKCPKKSIKIV
jgi:Pyruvate/2-oxoacid:ferredoxin oxidoreductase delta subunit